MRGDRTHLGRRIASILEHPFRLVSIAIVAFVQLGLAALAATATPPSVGDLLKQQQRPAVFPAASAGPGRVQTSIRVGHDRAGLTIAPNRATVRNAISVSITYRGRPVGDARITVTFSMPTMAMWNAFALTLAERRGGRYSASVPVVGMTGLWQLHVQITPPGAQSTSFIVADRVGA